MEIDIAKTGRSVVTVNCTLRHKPNILHLINGFLSIANELLWKNKRTSLGNKFKKPIDGHVLCKITHMATTDIN